MRGENLYRFERDCGVAMQKLTTSNVYHAVGIAMIVSAADYCDRVKDFLNRNEPNYPNVYILMNTSRLFFVVNRLTLPNQVAMQLTEVAELRSTTAEMSTKLAELR